MATIFEELDSREGNSKKRTWKYKVFGATDEQAAIDLTASTVPDIYQGLIFSEVDVETVRQDPVLTSGYPVNNIHDTEVTFKEADAGGDASGGGTSSYAFSFQAPSAQIITSLETLRSYGIDPANPEVMLAMDSPKIPSWGQAINVQGEGAKAKAQGITLPVPSATNTWTFTTSESQITDAYQRGVESIMGTTNKFNFKGRPAGSMLFVSCRGGVSSTEGVWQIEFGMAYSGNREDIAVGPVLKDMVKRGWELMWVLSQAKKDETAMQVVLSPRAVYIERVFHEADFNVLGF